jgi:hypothetical protein
MDRHTLAKLMGHSSPRITEKYYIHVTEPHIRHCCAMGKSQSGGGIAIFQQNQFATIYPRSKEDGIQGRV